MRFEIKKILIASMLLLFICPLLAQFKNNIKTNVLSLLITSPQLSYERQISSKSSITLSGYKGKFTFISESRIQGANLLYRRYFSEKKQLAGLYPEIGLSIHGEYRGDLRNFDYIYGPRGGIGFQFGSTRWVFDLGVGLGFYFDKYDQYDTNGNIIGDAIELDPNLRINSSIGYRF